MDIFDFLKIEEDEDSAEMGDTFECADLIGEDGYLYISQSLWKRLNEIYDRQTIRELITETVFQYNLEPPYKIFSEEELWEDFSALKNKDLDYLINMSDWSVPKPLNGISEEDYLYNGNKYYFARSSIGLKTSDHFAQSVRFLATNRDNKGITRTWQSKKMLHYIWNGLWGLKYTHLDRDVARACLRMRKYMAGQFRPSVAKQLYETFQAKRILDPSAGWGDRLSGFLSAEETEHYVGIDPNSAMHPKYKAQYDFYSQRVSGKKADFILSGSETVDLSEYKEYFDFCFTSPPYFDAERYTTEPTQSFLKYPTIDKWLEHFFFPTLKKCWDSLAVGGRLAINIVDVYVDPKNYTAEICKPMLDFMATLPNCHFEGTLGYQIAIRTSSRSMRSNHLATEDSETFDKNNSSNAPMCEPIWVWCKGKANKPLFLQNDFWFE